MYTIVIYAGQKNVKITCKIYDAILEILKLIIEYVYSSNVDLFRVSYHIRKQDITQYTNKLEYVYSIILFSTTEWHFVD